MRNFLLKWIAGVVLGLALVSAAPAQTPPLNYDTQVLAIFRAASGRGGPITVQPVNATFGHLDAPQKAALQAIYTGLKRHTIFLKNVVWRPDLQVIRLTWANNADSLVFKVVYKVNHDPVLTNSIYADKSRIVDVKIMFLDGGRYRYLHLNHLEGGHLQAGSSSAPPTSVVPPPTPYGTYTLNAHLSPAQCAFCHLLVPGVNGKPGGVFFPRYQESGLAAAYKGESALRPPMFFRRADFQAIDPSTAPVALPAGLPRPLLFQRVTMPQSGQPGQALYSMYARTLFETPELLEAWARDNHASVCISVDFGPAAALFGQDNYVCADNARRTLFVRFRNSMLSSTPHGLVHYARPYYVDQ